MLYIQLKLDRSKDLILHLFNEERGEGEGGTFTKPCFLAISTETIKVHN